MIASFPSPRFIRLYEAEKSGGLGTKLLEWMVNSNEGCVEALSFLLLATLLTLGCTNGTVLNLYWSQLSLTSEPVATTSNLPELRLPPPQVLPLWPHADGMPVHHIAWQRKADVRNNDLSIHLESQLVPTSD